MEGPGKRAGAGPRTAAMPAHTCRSLQVLRQAAGRLERTACFNRHECSTRSRQGRAPIQDQQSGCRRSSWRCRWDRGETRAVACSSVVFTWIDACRPHSTKSSQAKCGSRRRSCNSLDTAAMYREASGEDQWQTDSQQHQTEDRPHDMLGQSVSDVAREHDAGNRAGEQ